MIHLAVVAINDSDVLQEDEVIIVDVLANDVGSPLTLVSPTIINGQPGTVSINSNRVQYDPGTNFYSLQPPDTAEVRIEYTADNGTNTDTAILTLTVLGINQSPQLDNAIADQAASVGVEFVFTFAENTFSDPDNL